MTNYRTGGRGAGGYPLMSSAALQMPRRHLDLGPSVLPEALRSSHYPISSGVPHGPCSLLSLGPIGAALHARRVKSIQFGHRPLLQHRRAMGHGEWAYGNNIRQN